MYYVFRFIKQHFTNFTILIIALNRSIVMQQFCKFRIHPYGHWAIGHQNKAKCKKYNIYVIVLCRSLIHFCCFLFDIDFHFT